MAAVTYYRNLCNCYLLLY